MDHILEEDERFWQEAALQTTAADRTSTEPIEIMEDDIWYATFEELVNGKS